MAARRKISTFHKKSPGKTGRLGKVSSLLDIASRIEAESELIESASTKEPDYDNESWLDLTYNPGSPVVKGIPWEEYSELEIQTILKIHFEEKGYDVIWRHRDDAANEAGVDLECSRKGDGHTLLVAVKKHPKKDALAQLVELKNTSASKRVYVYIGKAARSFRDQSDTFKDAIELWDERLLEEQLNSNGLTLRLKIDNSQANKSVFRITNSIVSTIRPKSVPKLGKSFPSLETLETLWGMKDRAVTVNQCLRMAQHMFEAKENFSELSDAQVQNIALFVFDFVYAFGLRSLEYGFSHLSREMRTLLQVVHKKTAIRSNWLMLYTYRPGLMSGWVATAHKDYEDEKAKMRGFEATIKTTSKAAEVTEPKYTNIDDAANQFRSFANWAYGLEATIDDLYTKCVRGDVRS